MSILPPQNQGSSSSSSSSTSSLNFNPQHGHNLLFSIPPLSPSSSSPLPHSPSFESLRISDSPSPTPDPLCIAGPAVQAAEDFRGSSEEVTEQRTAIGLKTSPSESTNTPNQHRSGGQGIRLAQSRGKMLGTSVPHSTGKKSQMTNGNYLLNFQYDPISRPQPRASPMRRQQKIRPYNKDLFLQANYKFVLLDSGNYSQESMDPDKTLCWEDIICVRYSTPSLVRCPICLEYPLCPQITSCGHIFCFPCILRHLLMGEEDHKGDCWKRCPLCFVMISPKDLYTVDIENVNLYSVGDTIEFVLLTRQKDSFSLLHKIQEESDITACFNDEIYDPFSKFRFTSDVDLSVRKAISELDGWLVKADSGFVDDLEKLPYVCAAMEQLEQRRKYWNEHRSRSIKSCKYVDHQEGSLNLANVNNAGNGATHCGDVTVYNDVNVLSSYSDKTYNGHKNLKDRESYNFYQAADGQHIILHPLDMKCLLHHYGSYDMLPHRISGRILQLEAVTQSEATRRRYRYLSHFSLTTTFQLCEVDLSNLLPPVALLPYMDEIKKRDRQRKQLAKKEQKEKNKAEAAVTYTVPILPGIYHNDCPTFSIDDFEALGNSVATSSSPPVVGERELFSSVTRLGFAAGHDSPALKAEDINSVQSELTSDSLGVTGLRNAGTPSFANVISRAKSVENSDASRTNELRKKGKKASRVLLSTAGGRRY